MKLSKIKISGFKSFVDPTTITVPSNLIAVVGPNGCGKSNIIDAATWVMGESSPKYMRGESSTDVIFNGSNGRKPVGQASVELIFDNSDGTIGGEYAAYAEISIKRVINRDADSVYYLNGVRCRKRDIVGIFLGTGLGPRSYSIIGQNMITRIIEAKPDELRTYLEEAAGISKYKERRHETELRINHTRENLARVNDLRMELEKQLAHLKHQASVAEKYKTLKEQERTFRAELYAIQWRELDSRMVDYTLQIQREETALEGRNSELSSTHLETEQFRNEQRVAQDGFQEVQRRYYAAGNEITRIEQDVLHHQERQQQWEGDLKHTEHAWQQVKNQMAESEDNLRDFEYDIQQLEPQLESATQEAERLQHELAEAEEVLQDLQTQWEDFNQTSAQSAQTAQVEKTRLQHLEEKMTSLQKRQDQLQQQAGQVNFDELTTEIETLSRQSSEAEDKLENQHETVDELRHTITTLQDTLQKDNKQLDQVRSELQRLRGQQASLEALQQTALGQRNNPAAPWIERHQLGAKPRLAQHIEVQKGWELAVEKVLGFCLQAICVDQFADVAPFIEELKTGKMCVFASTPATTQSATNGPTLISKVKSRWPLDSLLSGIYVADTLQEALDRSANLQAHESIITRDGVWVSQSWMKILREEDAAAGVFQREEELKDLLARIDVLQTTQEELEEAIKEHRTSIQTKEQQRDQLQQTVNQLQAQTAQMNAQHKMKQERLVELKAHAERMKTELEDGAHQYKTAQQDHESAREQWQAALTEMEEQSHSRDQLLRERDQARQQLQRLREQTNQKKERMHEVEIRLQTTKSQKSSLQQAIMHLKNQHTTLNERKVTLQKELSAMPPMDTLKETLSRALDKHVKVESELNTARVAVESLEHEARNLETKRSTIERDINKHRTALESLRVELQGWKVKAETLLEQINATDFQLEEVLRQLPPETSIDEWQTKLDQVVTRINRLGPINLVAIDEYATCSERKEYLDKQVEDLQSGLTTLEEAIAKIDRETRTRFKETFDQVNQRFQELFPTIFGGGKAYLEMTSEDLLETGITMMACPPGKRNSTIYLLSGGEKSLTAIALIFSIFYLNPAPFCMLDEVDAALDDANVVRFTRLVKAMADKTQFIFISHNKITIEMGQHLIGVTMNEPGVSRLVSVDIEKAISMTESS